VKKLSMAELNRISVDDFKATEKIPLIVVLDNIRSLNNIGSVFRTSDAFKVQSIYLCGITGTPPNKEIHKTALGATESVSWHYFEFTEDAIQKLKSEHFRVFAVEQASGSVMLNLFTVEDNTSVAVVFGNEVNGVSDGAMALVDGCIEIPQFGTKHSFNIAVSAGIVLWELFKFYKK
jgi:23S rRNA (guanosine2251-2'-O)-methyltransferase